MPYPSYPDEYRQKFYEDGHYKSIYFVESMNNVEIVPGGDLKVNPVEDPLRPGNKTIVFTEEQLIREKFTYKEYLNSANNICVGSCECNSIEFTIRNNGVIPPLFYNTGTEQVERTFKVYVYFDHDSSTLLPLGMFRVVDDSLSGDKKERNIIMCDYMNTLRDLDAYDWYQNFKKAHPNGSTLKVFRDSFWDFMQNPDPKKGIKFPVTQKTQTLINDNVTIAYTLDEDTILLSAGNIIEDLCEINGVWGRFSRDVDSQNRSIFEYVEIPHITSKTKITKWRSIEPFQRDRYITHDWYQTKPIRAVTIRNAYDANIAQYASAELETRDNEGNVTGRFGNYAIYDNKFIDEIKSSADNAANDTDPEDDPITPVTGFDFLKRVCKNVLSKIKYVKYTPYELTTVGDLARTCGDIIYVNGTGEDDVIEELQDYTHFFSYVFERELKGIQNMRDTYRAKGDRVLPMFGDSSSSSGYTSSGGGGAYVVQSSGITGGTGIAENVNTTGKADGVPLEYWPELIRNVGLRVPDSPKGKVVFDKATGAATITWTDPADYDDNKPIPSVWEKTYLLRSYKGRPWNIYDPSIEVLVTETVKDTYKTNGFVDSTAGQHDKIFYAIFPQNTAGYVNPFTVLSIKPDRTMEAPVITEVKDATPHTITVDHTIPDQTSTYSKKVVVANPDHEPLDATDGIATVITNFASTVVSGLEQNRDYYFKVFLVKASGAESESDYDEGKTGAAPLYNYLLRIVGDPETGSLVETVHDMDISLVNNVTVNPDGSFQLTNVSQDGSQDIKSASFAIDYMDEIYNRARYSGGNIKWTYMFDFKIPEGYHIQTTSATLLGYIWLSLDGMLDFNLQVGYQTQGHFLDYWYSETGQGYCSYGDDTYHRACMFEGYDDDEWHTARIELVTDSEGGGWCSSLNVYVDDENLSNREAGCKLPPPFSTTVIKKDPRSTNGIWSFAFTEAKDGGEYSAISPMYRNVGICCSEYDESLLIPMPRLLMPEDADISSTSIKFTYKLSDEGWTDAWLISNNISSSVVKVALEGTHHEYSTVTVEGLLPNVLYQFKIVVMNGSDIITESRDGSTLNVRTKQISDEVPLYTFGGTYGGWFEDTATGLYMTSTPGGSGDGAYNVSAEGAVSAVDGSKYGMINFATRNGSSIVHPYSTQQNPSDLIYRIEIRRRVGVDPSTQQSMFYTMLDSEGSTIRETLEIGNASRTPRFVESSWMTYSLNASGSYSSKYTNSLYPSGFTVLVPEDGLYHTVDFVLKADWAGKLQQSLGMEIYVDKVLYKSGTASYAQTLSLGLPYANINSSLNGPHYPSRIVINKGWELKSFKVLYKKRTS